MPNPNPRMNVHMRASMFFCGHNFVSVRMCIHARERPPAYTSDVGVYPRHFVVVEEEAREAFEHGEPLQLDDLVI